jgi:tetratricopeptide (TPR) repeat protein
MSTLVLERPKEAISIYDEPLAVKTDEDEAWFNRGIVLINLGQFEEAIASFDKVLEIQPNLYEVWYNRGLALLKLGRLDEAFSSFNEATQINPDFHEAWNNQGSALLKLGRLDEAFSSFDKATQINPDSHQIWYNRGIALGKLGHLDEAIASYDKAIEFKPDDHEAWYNRGSALGNLGRLYEALASFNKALEIRSDDHDAWYNLGSALGKLGRLDEAIASYDKATELKPNDYEAWYSRGIALRDLRRYEEALTSFDKALEFKPDYHEAWYNRGNVLVMVNLGRVEEALTSFDKALKFKPDYHEAWNSRGYVLLKSGRLDEAITSFDKALEFKPDKIEAFYNKACCYALQGDVEQAIQSLQQAIQLSPDQCRNMAKIQPDFDSIRASERFQALIQEESQLKEGESKLLHNVSWEEFENILAQMGDNRAARLAYDRGTLEIIMPSQPHEYYKEIISFLVQELADEMGKDCEPYGSTTWRRKAKEAGAEPDNSFYIQNESLVRGRVDINLDQDPPPDLVLEIDYTSKSLDRMAIYARLGVPEIWRYDENVLRVYQLESGEYKEIDGSFAFEGFPAQEIPGFIEQNISAGRKALRQRFRAWVRQYLIQTKQLKIDYPTDLVDATEQTWEQFEQEAKWAMAVKLFEMKRISSGKAAQLVGTDRVTFLLNLHRYGTAMIDLEEEELLSDLENA